MTRLVRRLNVDIPIGIRVGLLSAAVLSIMAAMAYLASLVAWGPHDFKREIGLNLLTVILLYAVGGVVGGVIIGVLRPLRPTALGSFVIGTISSYPLFLAQARLAVPGVGLYPQIVLVALGVSIIFGGGVGAVMHGRTNGWTK